MRSKKLTPSEVLQKQKEHLRSKSDALIESLENDLDYVQHNFGTIIGNTIIEAAISKTPPLLQSLLGKGTDSDTTVFNRLALIEGVLNILPLFIKGKKGWLVRLIMILAKKWIFKQESN